jgi:hypothetical protein
MMTPEIKDTLANGATITALGSVLMDWQAPLTLLLVLTGVLLNITRLYDWYRKRDNRQ